MNVTYNNKPAIMQRNGQVVLGDVGGIIFQFIAIDLDGNELGATEQIKVESVSTETVTEVQATFVAKLATPQNVTANGTTVSWDEVENATSYDVLADGASIGEVENETEDALAGTWVFNDTVSIISAEVSVNFKDLNQKQYNGIAPSGLLIYYGFIDDSGVQDGLMAYSNSGGRGWINTAYKTITITSKLSEVTNGEQLLAWLEANAIQQSATSRKSVDLTTLAGWEALSSGTHNITIVAKAAGYIDSEKSAGVEVTKSASPKTLEESTWAEIAQVSANKSWDAMGWKVGDSKTITLNGTVGTLALDNYQCKVYIIGFDHNAEKEGQGISFGMLEGADGKQLCLADQYYYSNTSELMAFSMNTTRTNAGGWKAAKMRKTILGSTDVENGDATPATIANPAANTLMEALPADLRAVLKPITKYTDNVGNSEEASAISPSIDYLPLMAEFEVFGVQTYANSNEKTYQAQYEYYKSEDHWTKVKRTQIDANPFAYWWLRSPISSTSYSFCCVDTGGAASSDIAYYSYGVAPAFLV